MDVLHTHCAGLDVHKKKKKKKKRRRLLPLCGCLTRRRVDWACDHAHV